MGLLWYSAKQFTIYSLKLDWRMAGDDNSGVFIGFPPSTDPWSAVNNGYEIQIDATDAADRTTGAVYSFKSADIAARDAALNPPGEWNTYEMLVEGERLQVFLNGVKINDFTNTDPVRSLRTGYIGIQNHGTGDDVVVPQHPDQGAGRHRRRRRHRPGRGVQLGQRRQRVHQGRRQRRPDPRLHRARATGPRTTGST